MAKEEYTELEPTAPEELRAIRQMYGMSQEQFAVEALGMQKGGGRTLRSWENSESPMPRLMSMALLGVFTRLGEPEEEKNGKGT